MEVGDPFKISCLALEDMVVWYLEQLFAANAYYNLTNVFHKTSPVTSEATNHLFNQEDNT